MSNFSDGFGASRNSLVISNTTEIFAELFEKVAPKQQQVVDFGEDSSMTVK